jgi:hypothetical protein
LSLLIPSFNSSGAGAITLKSADRHSDLCPSIVIA